MIATTKAVRALGLVPLLSLALTACGGGSGGSATTQPTQTPTPTPQPQQPPPQLTLEAHASVGAVDLSWNDTGAASYDLYRADAPGCDTANYAACPGGTLVTSVTSPYRQTGLTNGKSYWFTLEAVGGTGTAPLSNEVGARPDRLSASDVDALAVAADGTLYLGGDFSSVGVATGGGVVLDKKSGLPGGFPFVDGAVYAVASDGAGGWYIGGAFDSVGGLPRQDLAHIRADFTVDDWQPQLAPVSSQDATEMLVLALVRVGDTVYFSGEFGSVNGQTRVDVAAVGTDGTLRNWYPDIGSTGIVSAFAVQGNTIYIGGQFSAVDGHPRDDVAALDTGGTLLPWAPVGTDGNVDALAVDNGTVYVGGFFQSLGGQARSYLGAISADGTLSPWRADTDGPIIVLRVANGVVYAGGSFGEVNGQPRSCIAAVGTDGTLRAWAPSVGGVVTSLEVDGDTVYFGGSFPGNDNRSHPGIAAVKTDGTVLPWHAAPDADVYALSISADTVYAGGPTSHYGGTPRTRLAAILSDGTLADWAPQTDGPVKAIAVVGDAVYVGGNFSSAGGENQTNPPQRLNLAAFGTDGTLLPWNPRADLPVLTLAADGNTLYAGGDFAFIGGTARHHLAAVGTDGTLLSWDPNADGTVRALAVANGVVYAGGDFSTVSGSPRTYAAAIDTSGTLAAWNIDLLSGQGNDVESIAVAADTIYLSGDFGWFDSQDVNVSRHFLAAFGTDGSLRSYWNPQQVGSASALLVDGGVVYAAGSLSKVAGLPRRYIAAIDTSGATLDWNPGAPYQVTALAKRGDTIFIGPVLSRRAAAAP